MVYSCCHIQYKPCLTFEWGKKRNGERKGLEQEIARNKKGKVFVALLTCF